MLTRLSQKTRYFFPNLTFWVKICDLVEPQLEVFMIVVYLGIFEKIEDRNPNLTEKHIVDIKIWHKNGRYEFSSRPIFLILVSKCLSVLLTIVTNTIVTNYCY